jgi:3-phosphoshikimate 1-carboxyvinyltransferase
LAGYLAPKKGCYKITGDDSLKMRPMRRIIDPLTLMGAKISSNNGRLPITITGTSLHSIKYEMPVRSAQVKSSIIIAALQSTGSTTIIEKVKTRDHTERMISFMNGRIRTYGNFIEIEPSKLSPLNYTIPGDLSAAANFILFCLMHKNCKITIKNILLNPTRMDFIKVLLKMGANISTERNFDGIEEVGTIRVSSSRLKAITIDLFEYPNIVDEIPIIASLAPLMDGILELKNAGELRLKESDRITAITNNLSSLGVRSYETKDTLIIPGNQKIFNGKISTYNDHRIEMAFAILSTLMEADIVFEQNKTSIDISYPNFYKDLYNLVL